MAFDFSIFHDLAGKAIKHVKQDLATLRTGKASVQLLDPVKVVAYGAEMKVNELANVSAPDSNLLIVKPWDTSILENLEKSIATAGLNLNPVVDGDLIRIVIPPLTEERRKEMVKLLYQKVESGKVMVRSIRSEVKQEIEDQTGEANVSEDDISRGLKELDELTQAKINQLEEIAKQKETELMTL